MECIEAKALKSSFLRELTMKSAQQARFEDLWSVNAINGVPCEDFSVDTFLDLSGKEFEDGSVGESEEEEEKDSVSISSQDRVDDENSNSSGASDSGSFSAGELSFPVDDMEDLEWLSQIVDDSVSEFSLLCPAGSFKENAGEVEENRSEPGSGPALHRPPSPCFPVSVPAKARSKRCRPNGRVWSVVSPPLRESAPSLSSSSSSSSTACLFSASPVNDVEIFTSVGKPPAKKQKRNTAAEAGGFPQTQRRCTHCQVQKTPQWRAGPLGPKTLCNACGVRYKSGRLFPEYRPACSPTFSGDIHSNSHRKVLEMRRMKETADSESGLTSMAPSF